MSIVYVDEQIYINRIYRQDEVGENYFHGFLKTYSCARYYR